MCVYVSLSLYIYIYTRMHTDAYTTLQASTSTSGAFSGTARRGWRRSTSACARRPLNLFYYIDYELALTGMYYVIFLQLTRYPTLLVRSSWLPMKTPIGGLLVRLPRPRQRPLLAVPRPAARARPEARRPRVPSVRERL